MYKEIICPIEFDESLKKKKTFFTIEKPVISPIEFDDSLIKKKEINFIVNDKPFGKQRPRFARKGRYISTYTPRETVEYENKVRKTYQKTVGDIQLEGPIEVNITGVFPIPESASKKQKIEMMNGTMQHTKKPDCDNIGKSILDALNGVAFKDDAQICMLSIRKKYGDPPKVIVSLKEIN